MVPPEEGRYILTYTVPQSDELITVSYADAPCQCPVNVTTMSFNDTISMVWESEQLKLTWNTAGFIIRDKEHKPMDEIRGVRKLLIERVNITEMANSSNSCCPIEFNKPRINDMNRVFDRPYPREIFVFLGPIVQNVTWTEIKELCENLNKSLLAFDSQAEERIFYKQMLYEPFLYPSVYFYALRQVSIQ